MVDRRCFDCTPSTKLAEENRENTQKGKPAKGVGTMDRQERRGGEVNWSLWSRLDRLLYKYTRSDMFCFAGAAHIHTHDHVLESVTEGRELRFCIVLV